MAYKEVVQREIKLYLKNPLAIFVSFILPLILCSLICIIFYSATPKDLPIGVYNADNSQLSRLIVRDLNTLQSCKVKYQLTNLEEGKKLLIEGKIYAFVVIPKNFQRDIYRFSQPQLVLYYNNQRILIGGIVSKDITLLAKSLIVGLDAKIKSKKGMPFDEAVKQSNLINVVEHTRSNPYLNYLYLISLTAFGHIIQISMIMTSVFAIGIEFKYGTAKEWLKEADNSIIIAFLGKLTPYFIVFFVLFMIVYLIYFGICQAPFVGNVLTGIMATLVFVATALSLGAVFMSINGNFRFCLSGATFYSAIGFALAGVTYPVMSMPLIIRIYTSIMPLNYWTQLILDQSLRNIPPFYDLKFFIPSLCLILVSFIALYRLKLLAMDESRWFRQ